MSRLLAFGRNSRAEPSVPLRVAGKQRSYRISKRKTTVAVDLPSQVIHTLTQLATAVRAGDRKPVLALTERCLAELCEAAELPPLRRVVLHSREYARWRGGRIAYKLMGKCSPDGVIELAFRTAARGQVRKPSAFLNTLLHEFMHHYDFHRLKIHSLHTSGFFARIRDLKARLGWTDREPPWLLSAAAGPSEPPPDGAPRNEASLATV